ncbi:MAG: hypothetical protein EOP53_18980, partial [Sphingobacteriales bacterium]
MPKNALILNFWLFCLVFFTWNNDVFAQRNEPSNKAKEYFQQALQRFPTRDYEKAISLCEKAISESPKWPEPYLLLGDIFQATKQSDKEIDAYSRLLAQVPNQYAAMYNLANVYSETGKINEAIVQFNNVQQVPGVPAKYKDEAAKRVKEIAFAAELMRSPVPYDPKNLGPKINSTFDDYFPTFTVDGETIYFTRRKVLDSFKIQGQTGFLHRYNEDIFVSRRLGINWQPAKEISEIINTEDNEGAMTISPDGSYMIFTGCERNDGLGSCDLYISFFMNGEWTKPANMQEPINTRFKETQPTISYDGRTIYFASNRPGTLGGLDLWMSTRDDNWNFSTPVNLGAIINTKDDEQSPFIHTDNQTLYFCSRGHLGMGRNDIFISRKNAAGSWDSVKNIGYPINTVQDEPGLIVDRKGEYAYMSSSNKNSAGGLDIFYFKLPKAAQPKPVNYLKGKVYDAYTKKTLTSSFELVDLETGTTANKSVTGKDGQFLVTLPGGKNYMLNVSAKGYLFYSENLPLKDYNKSEPYTQDIALYPIKAGEKITLNNIFFKTSSFDLETQSVSELKRLVNFLKENSAIKIEISGHTDNMGTPEKNKTLSQNRAKAVYDYLVNEGILATRLIWKGYGETQPVAKNDTEENRAKNRRTEVKVI